MAQKELTEGKPLKLILFFMIPIFLGNFFQLFYHFVDALIVGRFIGIKALAAVGATGSLIFFYISFIFASTQGFSIVLAQKFGEKNYEMVKKSLCCSIILSGILTLILTFLSAPFSRFFLEILKTPPEIINLADEYLFIMFAGIFATIYYNVSSNTIRALGDSKTPLYFLILSCIFNIIADILFVIVFKQGVQGVAIATVIAQILSTILCMTYMFLKFPILRLSKKDWQVSKEFLYEHIKIGIPMGIQMSVLSLGMIIVQFVLNSLGTIAVAAFTVATRVDQIFCQCYLALGATMATYTAQNFGAKKLSRIKQGAKIAISIVVIISIISIIILSLFSSDIVSLFMREINDEILKLAIEYLHIIMIFFIFLGILLVYRNILQGMGNAMIPLISGVSELIARGIGAIILGYYFNYTGVCYATPLAWLSGAIVLFIGYKVNLYKKSKKLKEGL